MAPCTCKIPDPIVLNGECLVCRGERGTKPPVVCSVCGHKPDELELESAWTMECHRQDCPLYDYMGDELAGFVH